MKKKAFTILATLLFSQLSLAANTQTDYLQVKKDFDRGSPVTSSVLKGTWKFVLNSVVGNCDGFKDLCIQNMDGIKDAKGRDQMTLVFAEGTQGMQVTIADTTVGTLGEPVSQGPLNVSDIEPQFTFLLWNDNNSVPMNDAWVSMTCRLSPDTSDLMLCFETKTDNHTNPGHLRSWGNEIVGFKKAN